MLDREKALEILTSQNPEQHLVQHALAAEAVMRALAEKFNEDPDHWGIIGLVHDVDFPHTKDNPEKHGLLAADILAGTLPDDALTAIMAHNSECTGVEPQKLLDYALRAAETVTGLVAAAALVRPTGYEGMEAKSVKKKMKDKAFAANVSRERIRECEKMGMGLDDFLSLSIKAMAKM